MSVVEEQKKTWTGDRSERNPPSGGPPEMRIKPSVGDT
jgi:hypothetical protein